MQTDPTGLTQAKQVKASFHQSLFILMTETWCLYEDLVSYKVRRAWAQRYQEHRADQLFPQVSADIFKANHDPLTEGANWTAHCILSLQFARIWVLNRTCTLTSDFQHLPEAMTT